MTEPVPAAAPPSLVRVAVFCGSRHGAEPAYAEAARALGRCLLARGIGLVYGGGDVGLMGVVADTVMDGGGEVIGVIPRLLEAKEVAHRGLTELILVDTMHERKRRIFELSDAVIAMPGGIGTMDELFEAMTWNQLGIHALPSALYDVDGYYQPLVDLLDHMVDQGFFGAAQRGRLVRFDDPDALLDALSGGSAVR